MIITDKQGNIINIEAVMGDKDDTKGHKMVIEYITSLQGLVQNYQERSSDYLANVKAIEDTARLPLLTELSDISQACIGEITMGYKMDAQSIGESIYKATGLTSAELIKVTRRAK